MPRISRAVAVGYPHHITQRGNYRQDVFEGDGDYLRYLDWLRDYIPFLYYFPETINYNLSDNLRQFSFQSNFLLFSKLFHLRAKDFQGVEKKIARALILV